MYPGEKVLAIFQPHLFSRTRDFGDDFATILYLPLMSLLLEIYPAREKLPDRRCDLGWLIRIKLQAF